MNNALLKEAWNAAIKFDCYAIPLYDKRPVLPSWKHLVNQPPKWEKIVSFPWARANQYGLVLPEDVVVLDMDVDEDGSLKTAWRELEAFPSVYKEAAKSEVFVVTASGGRHYYFQTNTALDNAKLGEHIDLKTCRGYVVGAGSPGYYWAEEPSGLEDLPVLPFWCALAAIH